jgi:hypothetical protein
MKKDKTVEIISVYKRLSSEEILDKVIEWNQIGIC